MRSGANKETVKIFGKLLHDQCGLVILLAALIVLHIVIEDD